MSRVERTGVLYVMHMFRGGGCGSPFIDVALALYFLSFSPQELGPRVCVPQGPSLLRMRQVFRKRVTALLLVITAGQSNDGDAQLLPVLPQGHFPWVERSVTQAQVSL